MESLLSELNVLDEEQMGMIIGSLDPEMRIQQRSDRPVIIIRQVHIRPSLGLTAHHEEGRLRHFPEKSRA